MKKIAKSKGEAIPPMYYEVNEQDWKLFRKKLVNWQGNYIAKLNQEYIQILSKDGSAADNFWYLERKINRDKRCVGVIAEMSRGMMWRNLTALLDDHIITLDDLDGFSEDLVSKLTMLYGKKG